MTASNFRSPNANATRAPYVDAAQSVFASAEVRAIEDHYGSIDMMRRAGRAAFEFLRERTTVNAKIALLVGPGNNGGDALACAAELAATGYQAKVVMLGEPARFGPDARAAFSRASELQIGFLDDRPENSSDSFDWIVDGLFGIGLKRPIELGVKEWCQWTGSQRAHGAKILSLDVPSGIDADTGALVGDTVIAADYTLTFIALKPGLLTGPALDHVGELHLSSLGLDASGIKTGIAAFGINDARALLQPSRANAHKGTQGTLAIVGGANGMLGAVLLAARAAMRMGAGKVKVGWLAETFPQVDPMMPEVMMRSTIEITNDESISALVIGCGLGISGAAVRALKAQLKRDLPIVLDADALNLVAESAELAKLVQSREKRKLPTIITPHPAEAARLLGASTSSVQNDRVRAARDLAKGYRCITVLKGAGTVIADGEFVTINTTGNPLLATAGTGDVLAGMIGALVAQGYNAPNAARIGVALHGTAADRMKARGTKRAVASDVITELANL
jgi:ADP-dependent NAD(P)H-hydrate dehydratase / NAD(P)H-hydrate epimerase